MMVEVEAALRCIADDLLSVCKDAGLTHADVVAIPSDGTDVDRDWTYAVGWVGDDVVVRFNTDGELDD
jgi:hypothetical protein